MTTIPGNQTLTVIRRGAVTGVDGYGKPIYGPDVETPIDGCSIQPLLGIASQEQLAATSTTVETTWRFFAPPGADIRADDRARCDLVAVDLQVKGDPVAWPDELGHTDHVEGYLIKYSG